MTTNIDALREELVRRRLTGAAPAPRATGIAAVERDGTGLPLSFGQQRLWFLDRVEPDGTDYLVPTVLRVRGELDVAALRESWLAVLDRHEILRTRYELAGLEPVQFIGEAPATAFAHALADDAGSALRLAEELAARPMSLERGECARLQVITYGAGEHLLVIVFHHIAYDGWSEGVFFRELNAGYRAACAGAPPQLPAPPIQYADFASWQRETADGDPAKKDLAYWTERLASLVPLELPTDRPRPPVRTAAGGAARFILPPRLADSVRALANTHHTTPFVVLLTAFQALLSRYSGATDLAVGVPAGGRERPELQNLVGFFVNTLVLRQSWTGEVTFADLLDRNRAAVLAGFDHQNVPFERLVQELDPDRDLSRTPLVQVMFGYQNTEPGRLDLPGITAEPVDTAWNAAKFDLNLQIAEAPDGSMAAVLEYSSELFDHATAERVADHFHRLLAGAIADPGTPVSALEYLSEAELTALLVTANDTALPRDDTPVHGLISRRARENPDATAIVAGPDRVSFGELEARANRLARHLREHGAGPESVVAVQLRRGPELVVALLAVLKTGAAYLPLEPGHPAERIAYLLADAGACVVVSESDCVPDTDIPVVLVDRDRDAIAAHEPADTGVAVDPDGLAYIIYTSGTTGRPKGVLINHRALTNYLLWTVEAYAGAPGGTALFSSVAFDLVVPNLYTSLLLGRPVHLLPHDLQIASLGELLLAAGPLSFVKLAPGHLELLDGQLGPDEAARLAGLVIAAGDSFTNSLANRWLSKVDGRARLAAEYGPTEITIGNSAYFVTGPVGADLVSLGTPIPNTTAYVLDAEMRPVAPGVVGEVYVGGVGVARGYRNRPALTAEKFVPDPFAATPGARLYRTGDLARVLPGGDFDFVGRVDTQIKIRGYRVEPGEIENALGEHPGVHVAAVAAHDGELIAYVVPTGAGAHPDELRALLADRLPGYMIPSAFVALDALPLTSNGKIDYRALPAPGRSARALAPYVAPRTETERGLAEVWRSVLGVPTIGVDDGFFELGGDSIRAVALVGALREAGFDVSVRDVFEHRTIARFAGVVGTRGSGTPDAPPVRPFELLSEPDRERIPAGITDAYPLSRVQLGMVFEMLSGSGEGNYHNVTSFRIRDPEPFSRTAFQAAVDLVVARHEVLRTSFDLDTYTEPVQLVHGTARHLVDMADLSHLPEAEQEQRLRALMAAERDHRFDLSAPPLLRFFTRAYRGGWWLTFTEFHPILEGWSFNTMIMEVLDTYRRLRDGAEPDLPPSPRIRYADFVALERRTLGSAEHREFWRRSVVAHPKFTLPTAWGAPAGEAGAIEQTYVRFPDLERGLRELATRADVPMKSVMHAAHLKVMSMLTGEPSFSSGLVCDTRPEVTGADRVLGMYLNTVPFPFRLTARTWVELVQRVFATEIELWPHRRYPLGEMQREFAGGARLADVYFNYLDFHVLDTRLVDVETSIDDSPNEFPLSVTTHPGLLALISRPQDVSRENRERLGRMYRKVLEAMAADPVGDARASYLDDGEREFVLHGTNSTAAESSAATLPDLFERQVQRVPDAVAVIEADGTRLSFAELDQRVNRLANVLVELGVGAETFTGVCLRPGVNTLVALLAVGKAGGAYLPLDPTHPDDRLGYQLADTAAAVLVTEGALAPRFAGFGGVTLCLDSDAARIAAAPDRPAPRDITPDNLVYTMYTSGSTGRPKGVLITHRGLINYLVWAVDGYGLEGSDGTIMLGSVAFDLSIPNFFLPLIGGKSVTLLPEDRSLETLAHRLAEPGDLSLLKITPAHLDVLRSLIGTDQAVRSVRTFVVGADEVKPETVAAWRRIAPSARIINEYGPTETVVGCSVHVVPDEFDPSAPVPIGVPIANMTMYVLDTNLEPLPVGVVGELYIGGAGVARGYLDRPGLTAERFLPDPYSRRPGARFYRTGDLARVRPDGELDFLGRIDTQVKIRGYRVELGEIEAVLLTHPDVSEAVVVSRADTPGERRLVGYVVAAPDATPDSLVLRNHLAAVLPEYMVPAMLVTLPELPLSAAGKVARDRLPVPEAVRPELATGYVAPATETERTLAAIWAQVLGLDHVGVHDDFFLLGGDSILTIQIVARARQAGLPLTPRLAVRHRTVAELAGAVGNAGPVRAKAAEPRGGLEYVPLTPIQQWWAGTPGHRDLDHYNQYELIAIDGEPELRAAVLERALLAVVDHHDALRLRLSQEHGTWRQRVARREDSVLVRETGATEPDALAAAARELHTSLSLADGPLTRALLLRGLPDGDRVLLAVHHWAVDTVSWPIIREDLRTAYRQLAAGDPVALPEPTASFAEWAHRLHEHAGSAAVEAEAAYWSGIPAGTRLPVDHTPETADTVADTRMLTVTLDPAATETLLRRVPAASGTRINEVLVAALGVTVTRWTGGDRMLLDLERHGREPLGDLDMSRTVGWFTAVHPVCVDLPSSRHPREVLTTVSRTLRSAPSGGIGYGLRPRADLRPELIFNYHGQLSGDADRTAESIGAALADLTIARSGRCARSHPLEISAAVHSGRLHISWLYSNRRHEESTVRRLAEDHLADLQTLIRHGARPSRDGARSGGRAAGGAAREGLAASLAEHGVPGVSVAVFTGGEIVDVWQEGRRASGTGTAVTAGTAFQCGSVSKHVTTLVALRLVADGLLDLDRDVSAYLGDWRALDTAGHPAEVTLRRLLTHTCGLTPAWYAGYHPAEPWPSLLDVLYGRPPARTAAVRVHTELTGVFHYSGSHFSVVQQVLCDVTGEGYPELARRLVFDPLGLEHTSFDPAFPADAEIAYGHDSRAEPVDGGWRAIPETAAAGLWTTPTDLARIALAVRQAAVGRPGGPLPVELVRQMLTDQVGVGYGLGTVLDERGPLYGHVGDTVGFRALSVADLPSAGGLVVLTNGDGGAEVIDRVADTVWREHPELRWVSGAGGWMRAVIGGSLGAAT